ncbi:hypothetical protein HY636_03840 [Candidatus Woesearchaeota archaeon]|nr:hypothetical protein [Candidatus Woesearchaeota archaeon]
MKRKPVWIPQKCFTRPIEHLKYDDYVSLLLRGEIARLALNIGNYLFWPYHFDNVNDFLIHQKELAHDSRCVFPEVEVRGIARTEGKLELILGDETGSMYATYTWEPHLHQFDDGELDMAFDQFNNPIMSAVEGDKLKIYNARYEGTSNHVVLPFQYYVLNEQAYQSISSIRKWNMRKLNTSTEQLQQE